MISFTVRMKFRPEERDEIALLLRELAETSRTEPGCVTYIPHTVQGEPDTVVIYEQYADQAAADAHRQTDHFARLAIGGLYQRMLDRTRENLDAVC